MIKIVANATKLTYNSICYEEVNIMDSFSELGRCISILDRLMKMYYDHGLTEYEIGWGQQFYVEYLYNHPGASAQEMVECIRVDKATLTKIVKKLSEIDYIQVIPDQRDRRVKHLYLTEKAIPAARRIKQIHHNFYQTLCHDISSDDIQLTEQTLLKMMENINHKIWHRMDKE